MIVERLRAKWLQSDKPFWVDSTDPHGEVDQASSVVRMSPGKFLAKVELIMRRIPDDPVLILTLIAVSVLMANPSGIRAAEADVPTPILLGYTIPRPLS